MSDSMEEPAQRTGILRSLGPALIVAAVVLGPGSILTSSKVGCEYGYSMLWVLAAAAILMAGTTAIAATLGQALKGTLCDELAARLGRPIAFVVGLTLFLVAAGFQASNNMAVITGVEPMVEPLMGKPPAAVSTAFLAVINLAIIVILFAARQLYKVVESMMKFLIAIMVVGFAANLAFAKPSLMEAVRGLIPHIPRGASGGFFPKVVEGQMIDPWWAVQGMVATTFSIAGAFYQAYLVREKGWTVNELKKGLTDSIVGIAALGLATSMILMTSASVLHGNVAPEDLTSAGEVAALLKPLFGSSIATTLFSLGILAGAFSSFLVNAMIGGTLLSDGLGLGASVDGRATKICTAVALLVGFAFAVGMNYGFIGKAEGQVDIIIFAQALTVLGGPILAFALLYLTTRLPVERRPGWLIPFGSVACIVTLLLALRTGWKIWLSFS